MLIYSAATFDQTMKPSRGVLLLSFAIFLPVSLAYRRWIRQYVVASSAGRSFLVIGAGARAARFYEAYKNSPNGEPLEFVDANEKRVGQPIAGKGSPIVQGNLAAKLNNHVTAASFSPKEQFAQHRTAGAPGARAVSANARLYAGIILRDALALSAAGNCRSVLAAADWFPTGSHFSLSLSETALRYRCLRDSTGLLRAALCAYSFVDLDGRRQSDFLSGRNE